MASLSRKNPPWWDREVDHAGQLIRDDVRVAAIQIWRQACVRARSVLGDADDAAMLLEASVRQISRYLDRRAALPFSGNTSGLLMVAFCRTLGRHATKQRRFKLFGGALEFSQLLRAANTIPIVELRLDVEKIVRRLSERGCTIIALKAAGYRWSHIARLLRTTAVAARSGFWREVKRARLEVNRPSARSG